MGVRLLVGCALAQLPTLPAGSVQTCVTSPPYFGLRDYGVAGQIGLEETPDAYVARLVAVFREVRRVLRDDGTVWLNLGDSYVSVGSGLQGESGEMATRRVAQVRDRKSVHATVSRPPSVPGLAPKNLLGIPWRVAFALQADGWWLRSDIVWHKPNPMPESVTDRPTKAHEYVFLLAKAERYYYDADAIAEAVADASVARLSQSIAEQAGSARANGGARTDRPMRAVGEIGNRNARTVWTIATQPYGGAHFATMPPALAERCILAGSRAGDTVLDPFGGAGTTALVADRIGRDAVLCELNPAYARLARRRITRGLVRDDVHADATIGGAPADDDHGPLFSEGAA